MNILFYIIPLAFVFSSFTSLPQGGSEIIAPKALSMINEEKDAAVSFFKSADNDDEDTVHPDWMHQITKIEDRGYHLVLEDGSVWETSWWGHFTTRNWNNNDVVTLMWDSRKALIKVKNLTQNNYVWASYYASPKSDAAGLKWVENFTDNYSTIELNTGTLLHSPYANKFIDWKKGEVVITVFVKQNNKKSYALWNIADDWIFFELEIL